LAFLVPWAVGWFFGISYFIDGQNKAARALECAADPTLTESYCSELGFTYDLQIGSYDQNGVDTHMYYARFFGTNLVGHATVVVLFFICFAFHQCFPRAWPTPLEEVEAEPDEGSMIGIQMPAWKAIQEAGLKATQEAGLKATQEASGPLEPTEGMTTI
jgi:hypothetical protein